MKRIETDEELAKRGIGTLYTKDGNPVCTKNGNRIFYSITMQNAIISLEHQFGIFYNENTLKKLSKKELEEIGIGKFYDKEGKPIYLRNSTVEIDKKRQFYEKLKSIESSLITNLTEEQKNNIIEDIAIKAKKYQIQNENKTINTKKRK